MRPSLQALIQDVRALPDSGLLRVFGSMLTRPDEAGDLDVGLVVTPTLTDLPPPIQRLMRSMLRLGAYGGPYYGSLDLFVDTPDTLWVRDDLSRSLIPARNARALRKALRAGEPFDTWYDRVIVPRRAPVVEPHQEAAALAQLARAARPTPMPAESHPWPAPPAPFIPNNVPMRRPKGTTP